MDFTRKVFLKIEFFQLIVYNVYNNLKSSMITDTELKELGQKGFIPGPSETEEIFLKRVNKTKNIYFNPEKVFPQISFEDKVTKPQWNWTRCCLINLFDFAPSKLPMFYNDHGLKIFEGAVTHIIEEDKVRVPLLQFRKKLKKGFYLGIYSLHEILAHEATHAARIAFDEPVYEEVFAYLTASSSFRKLFGPLVRSPNEALVFFGVFLGAILCQAIEIVFPSFYVSLLFLILFYSAFSLFFFSIFRLIKANAF